MNRSFQHWADLSPARRAALLVAASVQLGLLAAAQRDIHRRTAEEVRGSKTMWRAICLVNFIGPLSYFRWGRRAART